MDKLKNLFLYANASQESFHKAYQDILESNRNSLKVFSMIASFGMLIMIFASYFDESLVKNRPAYIFSMIVSFLIVILASKVDKKNKRMITIGMYIFVFLLYVFGIALGTVVEHDELSVSFPILLFAVPMFFTDVPLRMIFASLVGMISYIIAAYYTQSSIMFGYNLSNVIPYGIISMVVGVYSMTIKVRRYVLEEQNRFLIESDQLTGLLNRRSYEKHVSLLRKNGCDEGMLICALDINGLKQVNDNLGHHAGDELIIGAANCIQGVFGNYGSCYRVGGDEFVAILASASPEAEELIDDLHTRSMCFNGTHVSGLSISIGIVKAKKEDNIDALVKKADREMYRDKNQYYQQKGLNRNTYFTRMDLS